MTLPRFKPQQISEHDGKIEIVGSVSSDNFHGQLWLGSKWIGYMGRVGEPPILGRWFPVGNQWKFVSENRQALAFKMEEELCFYDGYWGERACIVLAPNSWKKEEFVPTKQWGHEHCGICWATIAPSSFTAYFLSSERDIVCPDCYQKYVAARSLAFMEEGRNSRPHIQRTQEEE